jgi:hypothetical protein
MTKFQVLLLVVLALVSAVVLGVLTSQLGGVSIRSASRTHIIGSLHLTNDSLLPGVPMTVRVDDVAARAASILVVRLPANSVVVGPVDHQNLRRGSFTFVVPCTSGPPKGNAAPARLVLVDNANQAVIAQSDRLTLLPAGPDCVR